MKRNSYTRGMTFFEILVVMGIFVLVGGFVLFVSMETYRGSSFRSDRDLLVAALQHARAQAMNNICFGSGCTDGKPHGVAIQGNSYIVFQGSCYASPCVRDPNDVAVDAVFSGSPAVTHSGLAEVVFSQLSGVVASPGTITLIDATGHVSVATTTAEGRIYWSN